ncbi:hypothetical protein C3L33_22081, partial [Rhododendron williamsianum]
MEEEAGAVGEIRVGGGEGVVAVEAREVRGGHGVVKEDDTAFERRSALFALAVSHVVLINMFYQSIGLEQAEWRIAITPLEVLERTLREDIQKIWDSIPMPEGLKRTPLSTFFNVEVVGLSSYLARNELFIEQVNKLRQRFNQSIAPGGLVGDRQDTICGSEFSVSTQKIWKTIKEDRHLDFPSHKVMISTVRCEEIANRKLEAFVANEVMGQLKEGAQVIPAPGFGKKYSSTIKSYLHEYDVETAHLDEGVRSEKRKHLEEKMMLFVQSVFQSILAPIGSRTLEEFKVAFHNALKTGQDFVVASHDCTEACMKSFDDRCADVIVEHANCNPFEEREKLRHEISNHIVKVHGDKQVRAPVEETSKWSNNWMPPPWAILVMVVHILAEKLLRYPWGLIVICVAILLVKHLLDSIREFRKGAFPGLLCLSTKFFPTPMNRLRRLAKLIFPARHERSVAELFLVLPEIQLILA